MCPVLPTPLPPSLHCCHLPTVPFFISLHFLPISPPLLSLCAQPHKNNLFLPPPQILPTPVWLCISMPAEHVNLSRSYRRRLVKLSSDSLQQDDHRMPVARRIRTVVTISNGGSNVLLCSHLLYCIQRAASCMAQWLPQREH